MTFDIRGDERTERYYLHSVVTRKSERCLSKLICNTSARKRLRDLCVSKGDDIAFYSITHLCENAADSRLEAVALRIIDYLYVGCHRLSIA